MKAALARNLLFSNAHYLYETNIIVSLQEGAVPSSAYSYAYIQRPSKLPPEKKKRSHTPRAPRTPKTPTVKKEKKKKKRRRRISDDEDDESDDDPDFVL